jgi:hypothetical protein
MYRKKFGKFLLNCGQILDIETLKKCLDFSSLNLFNIAKKIATERFSQIWLQGK